MDDITASIIIACQTAGAINSINKLGFAFGMLSRKFVEFGSDSIKVFSDLQEETQKFGIVFQGVSKDAEKVVKDLMGNFGQSELSARKMMALTGDMLTGFGLGSRDVLDLSAAMAKMGADIASFSNYAGGAEGATYALTKAMLGETEQAKMLGVAIKTDTPEFRKMEKQAISTGIYIKELGRTFVATTEQEAKAIAVASTIYEQKAHVLGDFARNQDSIANRSRTMSNRLIELKSSIGELVYKLIDLNSFTESFIKSMADFIQIIKKEGPPLVYAIKSLWISFKEGAESSLVVLSPIFSGIVAGFKNIVSVGEWMNKNMRSIFDGLSKSETNFLHGLAKDILLTTKNTAIWTSHLFAQFYEMLNNAIGWNKLIYGENRYYWRNKSVNAAIRTAAEFGSETEKTLASAKTTPFPKLVMPDLSPWVNFSKTQDEISRKYLRARMNLDTEYEKWISKPRSENKNIKAERESNQKTTSDMANILKEIFKFRASAQSAVLSNSVEAIRLQSRMLFNNANNPQVKLVEQGKRSVSLLERMDRTLTNMSRGGSTLSLKTV